MPAHSAKVRVATWNELADRTPTYALVAGVDLVVIRYGDEASVLYGRCPDHLSGFVVEDLTTLKRSVADLTGVTFAGIG